MAIPTKAEAMRDKRAESLGRTPRAFDPAGSPGSDERKFDGRRKHTNAYRIALDKIERDENQPRTEFDAEALERLASSMKARGQLQPCRVRWEEGKGAYVIVVGERRWRAARMAGLESLDCIVVEGDMTPDDLLEDQLVENAIREDLKPVEQARSFRALMDARGLTHRDLALRLNIAHTTVTRALGLLDLPEVVQAQVDAEVIKPTTAYAIAAGLDDPEEQIAVAARVVAEGLNREETVEVVRQASERKPARAGGPKSKGRGATVAKAKPLPTERKLGIGKFKVTVSIAGKKGFDEATLAEVLKEALEQVTAKIRPAEQGGEAEAA
jgi:ParB family chromosome partitioning protein